LIVPIWNRNPLILLLIMLAPWNYNGFPPILQSTGTVQLNRLVYIVYIILSFFVNNYNSLFILYMLLCYTGVTRRQSHVEPDKRCRLAVKPSRTRRSFFRHCNDGRSDHSLGACVRRRRGNSRPLRGPARSWWVFGKRRGWS